MDSLLAILNNRDYQAETLFSAELSVLLLIGIECGWTSLADSLSADHKSPVYFIVYRLQRKIDCQDPLRQCRLLILSDIFRMRRNPCGGNLRGCSNIKKLAQIKRNKKRSWLWNFFREAGRLSRKKSTISDTLLKKVNSNSLFYLMILQKHYIFSIFYIESIR